MRLGWWQKDMLSKLFSLVIYITWIKWWRIDITKMPIHVDDINQSIITAKVTWSDACNNGYWACMWLSISTIKSEHGITLITFSSLQSYMPPFYSFHAITIMTFPLKADHIKSIIYSLFFKLTTLINVRYTCYILNMVYLYPREPGFETKVLHGKISQMKNSWWII